MNADIRVRGTGGTAGETLPSPAAITQADKLVLSIRPEKFALGGPGAPTFTGEFLDAVFNGPTVTVSVRVGETTLTVNVLNDGEFPIPEKGSQTQLYLKKGGAALIPLREGDGNE